MELIKNEEVETKFDKAADYIHNYPDFKVDMLHGLFLGEKDGKYYFFNKGNIGVLEDKYNVANNIGNFFSGPIVQTNYKLRHIPPKMILNELQKVGDEEAKPSFKMEKDFPFLAEALCLETMRRIEQTLEAKTGINGWNHFIIMLEKFVYANGDKSIYFEGIDNYCFIPSDEVLMTCNPDLGNYDWTFAEKLGGFKVRKQTLMTLINREKFR